MGFIITSHVSRVMFTCTLNPVLVPIIFTLLTLLEIFVCDWDLFGLLSFCIAV